QEKLGKSALEQRQRLAAEIERLERSLAALKDAKSRQREVYSLIPFKGKRGDQRQPVYAECSELGVVFYPEGTLVNRPDEAICLGREIVARLPAGEKEKSRPYVLFLVRPEGIHAYYEAQRALDKLEVDFGYEFVEPDWTFDFEENFEMQPWRKESPLV